MVWRILAVIGLVITLGRASSLRADSSESRSAWRSASNAIARELATDLGRFHPVWIAAYAGIKQYESAFTPYGLEVDTQALKMLAEWKLRLENEIKTSQEVDLTRDLRILLGYVSQEAQILEAERSNEVISFESPAEQILEALMLVINEQSTQESRKAGLVRFKTAVAGTSSQKPMIDGVLEVLAHQVKTYRSPIWPYQGEVKRYLEENQTALKAVRDLLEQNFESVEWKTEFANFSAQVERYNAFVKAKILPNVRLNPVLPRELYLLRLHANGVFALPEELMAKAKTDFEAMYVDFESLARKIAADRKMENSDPASVFHKLREEQIVGRDEILKALQKANDKIEKLIREHDVVTLPEIPPIIQIASPEESEIFDYPYIDTPPVMNAEGKRPWFVYPVGADGYSKYPDSAFEAGMTTLMAHEIRPGHELQYATMIDFGTTLARSFFADNNANMEGWAVYVEMVMAEYYTNDEDRFCALSSVLFRIARMMNDPGINTGVLTEDDIRKVYFDRLGLSPEWVQQEIDRYTATDPGQAASYYYGAAKLWALRSELMEKLGDRFDQKRMHDFILRLGIFPIDLIIEEVRANFLAR
jgi:hypothetical protein